MPKKRNTSWVRIKKQKQILTARLIEISLKVEDYIYKHKPISECEAEQYMREVSSYKGQFSRDERSLQVIEKLTRCMKAIILDHKELRADIYGKNNDSSISDGAVRAGSISPVYSILDEDRAQLTQINEERAKTVTEEMIDVDIIDLSNIEDETKTTTAGYPSTRINVEVDMHRSMSSLSLRDFEDPLKAITTVDNCSQSILNNFEGVEMQLKNINVNPQGAAGLVVNVTDKEKSTKVFRANENIYNETSFDKMRNKKEAAIIEPNKSVISKTSNATNKSILLVNTNNNTKYKTGIQNKEPKKVTDTTNYSLMNTCNQTDNHITITSQTFYPATNKIPETQRQTLYDSNRTCTLNSSNSLKNAHNHVTQTAHVNPDTVKHSANFNVEIPTNTFYDEQNGGPTTNAIKSSTVAVNNDKPINNTAFAQKKSTTAKKKRGPRKKKVIVENKIKPKNKKVYRTPQRDQKKTFTESEKIPIYSANVVNDLSWIENIRYVREIRDDENDPKLNLEDSFWDNYYLPANWDYNEFV